MHLWASEKMKTWNTAPQCWLMTIINQLIWNNHHAPTSRPQHLVGQTNCFVLQSLYQLWQPSLLIQLLTLTQRCLLRTLDFVHIRLEMNRFLTVMFKIWKEPRLESLDYLGSESSLLQDPPSGWKIKTWKLRRSVWKYTVPGTCIGLNFNLYFGKILLISWLSTNLRNRKKWWKCRRCLWHS